MNSMIVPPTPNWYESSILACTQDNTLIYGARCDVICIRSVEDETCPSDVQIIWKAHSKRVISVDVNLKWGQPKKHFVTAGEDKSVKLWNAINMTLEDHHVLHDKSSVLVGAKFGGEDRVVSVSEDGNVVIWNISTGTTNELKNFLSFKSHVSCMSTCPHVPWLVAFGMDCGLVIVADIRKNGTIIHRLPAHSNSVTSLAWCPVPINIFPKYHLNYVGFRKVDEDSNISSENVNTDDNPSESIATESGDTGNDLNPEPSVSTVSSDDTEFQPKKLELEVEESDGCSQPDGEYSKMSEKGGKDEGASVTSTPRKPICEAPRKDYLLASSGKDGKICIWRAGSDGALQTFISLKSGKGKHRSKNEKMWIPLYWPTPMALLTTSKSYDLIKYTLPKPLDLSLQTSIIHDCHQSVVFCIKGPTVLFTAENWLDEVNLNAWTFSQDHVLVNVRLDRERSILAHYCTIDGSINCLSVSPVNPTRLGIGTNHVKIWNVSSSKPTMINMSRYYQKMQSKIIRLAWHPNLESVFAFATSEGRIGYWDIGKSQSPKILRNHYKHQINKIEWGPVDELGRLGIFVLSGGELIAFNFNHDDDSSKVVVDKSVIPYVYTFSWKPDYTMMLVASKTGPVFTILKDLKLDNSVVYFESKIESIIWHPQGAAVGDSTSKYHNFCAVVRSGNNVQVYDLSLGKFDVVSEFKAKGNVVTAVSWNPFNYHLMVICTNSGVAEVWNAIENCILSTCVDSFFNPILCAVWSPISEDCIIMGCRENALKIWKVSEHSAKDDEEIKKLRDVACKEFSLRSDEYVDEANKSSIEDIKEKRPDKLLPKSFHIRDLDHLITSIRKLITWQMNPEEQAAEDDATEPDIFSLFGDSDRVIDMLKYNEQVLAQRKKFDKEVTLSLFRGDVSSSIQTAINEHRVTPTIITLAPLVSTKMWQDACETYAKQLAEEPDSDHVEIAVHYLACHKIHEAIDVLCMAKMYHEAFVLAKCRLSEESDTVTNVISKWITYLIQNGNYEFAAVCYIYLEKYEEAAILLFKRSGKLLEIAAELADKAGNKALQEAILSRNAKMQSDAKKEVPLPSRAELFLKQEDITLQEDKQDIALQEDKQDITLQEDKQDITLQEDKQDITLQEDKQDTDSEDS